MLKKRMQDMTIGESLIVTGLIMVVSFLPLGCIMAAEWLSNKESKEERVCLSESC